MSLLTALVLLVGAVSTLNLLLTLTLIRRPRALDAAHALPRPLLPEPGRGLGDFALPTTDGGALTSDEVRAGDTLLAFLEPNCPPCLEVARDLVRDPPRETLVALVRGGADVATDELCRTLARVARVARLDDPGLARRVFGVTSYPTLLRARNGVIAAAGRRPADLLVGAIAEP